MNKDKYEIKYSNLDTMKTELGLSVIDAHSHFFSAKTIKSLSQTSTTRSDIYNRIKNLFSNSPRSSSPKRNLNDFASRAKKRSDINEIHIPDEEWDVGKKWVEEMDRYSIQAMGFMVGQKDYDEFLEAKKRFPGRFMGYANITPDHPRAVARVKKAARDGFKGIKLYPSAWKSYNAYDKICYPIYKEASKHNLLVFLHFGISIGDQADLRHANPIDIQLPSRDFPDLRFIVAHFGAGWFREVLLLQYQADNVYMDSSGSNSWMNYLPYDLDIKQIFKKAIKAGGPKKIIFGTDSSFFPRGFRYNILETQLNALKEIAKEPNPIIGKEDIDCIMNRNILEMTGFKPHDD